jgi:glycogen synthase
MKIVMLGWEYPPFISGGLGTACEGLTISLARHNLDLIFVVPHLFGGESAPHMRLMGSRGEREAQASEAERGRRGKISTVRIPALLSPYMTPERYRQWIAALQEERARVALAQSGKIPPQLVAMLERSIPQTASFSRYDGDIFLEVTRFAQNVVGLLQNEDFDLIHAHDWMTYPAAVALAAITKKPLVVHVHSLEYDRSGQSVNEQINQIERWGVQSASAVVAVSYYTRALINKHHDVPLEKISVVHNGVYSHRVVQSYRSEEQFNSRIVLFLGRITFQKGPDYFVEAAAKVIPHVPDVLFVMAGAGDMLPQIRNRIRELGIEKNFYFPGFLRGQEVEQMFSLADVYVMPSVSEPFGISALEAISFNTPVIISRQSGVSEVLGHALKADFWDIDKLADLIINALLHDELRSDMIGMAREEVKRLHWDAAALKTLEVYRSVVGR